MTYDEVAQDTKRFCDYLKANGKRPTAVLIAVCDDHDNSESVIAIGLHDILDEMYMQYKASRLGFEMVRK